MSELLFWSLIAVIGIGTLAAGFWMAGYFKRQADTQRAREKAELERLRADNEKRTADIFAAPRASRDNIADKL